MPIPLKFPTLLVVFSYVSSVCATESTDSGKAPLESFNQLMERSVVPLAIAKIFSLNDRHDTRVCVLNNVFANYQDTPQQCKCSFTRLRDIELQCANNPLGGLHDCSKKICETCCIISMTASYTEDDRHHNYPVNCKTRCLNSPITSDVTEDSQQFLSELLLKVNALYHADVSTAKQPGERPTSPICIFVSDTANVPTQYHVVHLEDQHDDAL
ncbi:hypothetical protein, conserved [Babesia bigemina]|uniref:Secreted protein n=1 Tax=Babesia bigemina TaxID=5866 RepID=A0A061DC20_BABBI|nr:hypothetical protein, conserved [Babesia bigemina]CDR97547.1 hypothetical protein, conserved [Babesia bigemina]|eukprot:XP_012769733.1 hypothetical protein, conserved [Babesia bigemina]